MKKLLALFILGSLAFTSCSSEDSAEKTDEASVETAAPQEEVVEQAVVAEPVPNAADSLMNALAKTGNHSTLIAAIEAAGLSDGLTNGGPYTIFAPTDEAFKKLNSEALNNLLSPESKDQLSRILTLHVVNGKVTAADLRAQAQQELITLNGQSVPVVVDVNGSLSFGSANVISPDIPASNGLIHSIDSVVLPAAN